MNIPSSRKTVKNHRSSEQEEEEEEVRPNRNSENFQELNPAYLGGRISGQPVSMDETKLKQDSNSLKINNLLNKITGFDSDSGSGRLADFKPPPNPTLTKTPAAVQKMSPDNPLIPALPNSNEPKQRNISPSQMFYRPFSGSSSSTSSSFSNYLDAHTDNISYRNLRGGSEDGLSYDKPYYAKKEDRLNYIVHMLEEMQKEKTNHVTEEFVLYTMLGVFIIYIVDGFARIGTKYVR